MKNIIISLLCAASFFVAAIIASAQEVAQTQKVAIRTSFVPHANNLNDPCMGLKGMMGTGPSRAIPGAASVMSSSTSEPTTIGFASREYLIPSLAGRVSSLLNGAVEVSSAPLVTNGSMLHRTVLSLKVSYTKNPLGGILKVRGDVMPVFSGVGASLRPNKSYEIVEALDELSEAQLQDALERVTVTLEGNEPIAALNH